jgi:Transglycosylase SLT domain
MTVIQLSIRRHPPVRTLASRAPQLRSREAILPTTALAALAALAFAPVAQASVEEPSTTTPSTQTAPSEATPPNGAPAPSSTPTPSSSPAPAAPPAGPIGAGVQTGEANAGPQVQAQHLQHTTSGGSTGAGKKGAPTHGGTSGAGQGQTQTSGGASGPELRTGRRAPSPAALTPSLPPALGGSIAGVPAFFIESFRIPPFLLPIYQAAGTAYGIPWQVLAAINEVETDYGRDLSVSSAGAEGWMQFLPATWAQYGVDANGDGFKDPYNPADAIFAAARYLRAAGGDRNVRAAVFAYNHSQAYVDSVLLRAQLLGGTPPALLGAITGLTESRFPVHAPAHFNDGFQTIPAHDSSRSHAKTLVGTTIYTQSGAPVIAVQDGEVVRIGDSPSLGRFVALRDAYGNTYVYAQLGNIASLYPVLEPHEHASVSARITQPGGAGELAPSGPATAGAQERSPLSAGATESSLALGAAAGLEPAPTPPAPVARPIAPSGPSPTVRVFRSGPNDVYLHPLRAGVQVVAGTVLGHVGEDATGAGGSAGQGLSPGAGAQSAGSGVAGHPAQSGGLDGPHMFFQMKPAGAQPIDPKPILDGWVALENTSIFRAKGENPFLATAPTVGQVLLESKAQLERQVAHDASIRMPVCQRRNVQTGRVDRRVLAALEFLSVSGLKPTVTGLGCAAAVSTAHPPASMGSASVEILAVNGVPIAGHQGQGSIADTTIRKLLTLQGVNRPLRIVSLTSVPGATNAFVKRSARDHVDVAFAPSGGSAHLADTSGSALTPGEWVKLIARLGEIPDPTVASGPSAAATPDSSGTPAPSGAASGRGASSATPGAGGTANGKRAAQGGGAREGTASGGNG